MNHRHASSPNPFIRFTTPLCLVAVSAIGCQPSSDPCQMTADCDRPLVCESGQCGPPTFLADGGVPLPPAWVAPEEEPLDDDTGTIPTGPQPESPPQEPEDAVPAPDVTPESTAEPDAPPPAPVPCTYPAASAPFNGIGDVLPLLDFSGAMADGSPLSTTMEDLYCQTPEAEVTSFVFILATEWCPNCPSYIGAVASQLDVLEANGAKVFFVDLQDRNYGAASHAAADTYFSNYLGPTRGTRVGAAAFENALDNIWSSVPNGFVVRRSDLAVVAHQQSSNTRLNYQALTANPERDWGFGAGPGDGPSICGDDEASEPNNTPAQAAALPWGDAVDGGICDSEPDFYAIGEEGPWRVDLFFDHAVGDLDIEALDASGERIGLSESPNDNEQLDGTGPATLRIYGWQGAQAPYRLRLTSGL